MLFHFLFDQRNGLGRDVASEIIEARELSEKWEEGVSYRTPQFREITDNFFLFIKFSKPSDFDHFAFKVCSVSEKVALVELVELVPYFLCVFLCLFILVLRKLSMIFLEFLLKLFFHLFGQLVEDNFLFGTAGLVQLNLADFDIIVLIILLLLNLGILLHLIL